MTKNKIFTAHPARGQALLSYDGRIPLDISIPLHEAEVVEKTRLNGQGRIGGEAVGNFLLQSDCLAACAWMRAQNLAADLVYIDPPFASGEDYTKTLLLRGKGGKLNQANAASLGEEVLYGDIWQKEDYLNWLYERLLAIREVMSETASIYLHLDWHIGHYAKVLMDEIFGEGNFINEVVWCYRTGGASKNTFSRKHDAILVYAKNSGQYVFNRVPIKSFIDQTNDEIEQSYIKNAISSGITEDGHKWWTYKSGQDDMTLHYDDETGRYFTYVNCRDWWADVDAIGRYSRERLGYKTQKPEELLERIIKASSNEGMLVADFFSGSGTTAAVAHKLGRRFIACDIGLNGVQTSRDRLFGAGAQFDTLKIKAGLRLFRNPEQTEKLLISHIPGFEPGEKAGYGSHWDGGIADKDGNYSPVKIIGIKEKLTMEIIGVVLSAAGEVDAHNVTVVYANKSPDVNQKKVDEEARNHQHSNCAVRLMSFNELLDGRVGRHIGEDSAEFDIAQNGKDACRVVIRHFYSPYLKGKIDEHNLRLQARGKKITIAKAGLALIESVQFDLKGGDAWQSEPSLEDNPGPRQPVKGEYEVPAASFRIKIRSIAGDETTYACDGKTVAQCDDR